MGAFLPFKYFFLVVFSPYTGQTALTFLLFTSTFSAVSVREEAAKLKFDRKSSVGDPNPHLFGPPGFGSIIPRYGSGSGSFPFLIKVLSGLKEFWQNQVLTSVVET